VAQDINKKAKKPRILAFIEGGVCHYICSDTAVDVMILDEDVEGIDNYEHYTDLDGDKFVAREACDGVEINEKLINHYFKQRRKK
jgi:hypothetical protein